MTAQQCRLAAVASARRALALIANPDPRSVTACDVAERYANGRATLDELVDAWAGAAAAADRAREQQDAVAYTAYTAVTAATWEDAREAMRQADESERVASFLHNKPQQEAQP